MVTLVHRFTTIALNAGAAILRAIAWWITYPFVMARIYVFAWIKALKGVSRNED